MDSPAEDLSRHLVADHQRLAALLERAIASPDIDMRSYDEFRRGLLRHIAIEEKILLPAAARARGGEPLSLAGRLRREHGAIAALLVPTPTPAIIGALRTVLVAHNGLEEGPHGLYRICERLAGDAAGALLAEVRAAPAVPVAAHNDDPRVMPAARRALARAGYDPGLVDAPGRHGGRMAS
jgi:hypothetical protein